MGNVTTLVLTSPFAVTLSQSAEDKAIEAGLRDLAFSPVDDFGHVWLLETKLHTTVDGLGEQVRVLPWPSIGGQPTHLEVLWADDYTTQDDSFGGRVSPYAFNRETWIVGT